MSEPRNVKKLSKSQLKKMPSYKKKKVLAPVYRVDEDIRRNINQMSEEKEAALHDIEKKSPFHDFVQINKAYIPHIIKACGENPGAMRLFFFLLMRMDKYNALMCTYEVFEERLGMSQATVARHISYLKKTNLIAVKKTGTNNVYLVSTWIAWTSKGTMLKYSEFPRENLPAVITDKNEEKEMKKRGKTTRVTVIEE